MKRISLTSFFLWIILTFTKQYSTTIACYSLALLCYQIHKDNSKEQLETIIKIKNQIKSIERKNESYNKLYQDILTNIFSILSNKTKTKTKTKNTT